MDYDYLSSIVSNYSNLTSLSTLGGSVLGGNSLSTLSDISALNGGALNGNALKGSSLDGNAALNGVSELLNSDSVLDSIDGTNSLIGANTFSAILEAAMKSAAGTITNNANTEDADISTNISKQVEDKLVGIAGAGTDSALEGEARSNMILQNYLYTAMMKDSLENSLTEKADFTSGLFSDLAVGGEDEDGSSTLSALNDNTLGAIGNYSAYKTLLDKTDLGEIADDVISSYGGQGSLLRDMLTSLTSELKNTSTSEETQAHNRNYDSHLRLRSAAYRRA
ncbi:hypothetical protein [Butyrivibrio sp. JL13D10]|uniref:hypothetical protein n=1 Tax=Butyrivibrio sp. JL13D10 TaxID=3236815 RepID=UPI0038B5823B